jgi:hypothetical protein
MGNSPQRAAKKSGARPSAFEPDPAHFVQKISNSPKIAAEVALAKS